MNTKTTLQLTIETEDGCAHTDVSEGVSAAREPTLAELLGNWLHRPASEFNAAVFAGFAAPAEPVFIYSRPGFPPMTVFSDGLIDGFPEGGRLTNLWLPMIHVERALRSGAREDGPSARAAQTTARRFPNGDTLETFTSGGFATDVITRRPQREGVGASMLVMEPRPLTAAENILESEREVDHQELGRQ